MVLLNERECTKKNLKGKLSYPRVVENCFKFVSLLSLLYIYICIFLTLLLFNMYKGEIVAVFQLFVIITIDVGYTSFHFVLVSDLTLQ